jgi:predicted MFS family arabinose efflux permease
MERAAPEVRGRVMTFFNGAFNAGMGASNLMWGALAQHHGYPSVFVGATLVALACGAVLALRPRPRELALAANKPPSADLA